VGDLFDEFMRELERRRAEAEGRAPNEPGEDDPGGGGGGSGDDGGDDDGRPSGDHDDQPDDNRPDEADRPAGYLLVSVLDGAAHIDQVSVHPDHARRGIGRELLERAASWALSHGYRSLTLTTYVDVPWNGPYYERLGFRYLTAAEETAGLRAIRAHEREIGLDIWARTSMARRLD